MGWERNLGPIRELLDRPDFDSACEWFDAHPEHANYVFCKQAMIAYCGRQALELQHLGIRINATAPGPTMTPLMAATAGWQGFEAGFRDLIHREGSTPDEQAWPLVFLTSPAASFVNGTCLIVDGGFVGAGTVGSIKGPMVEALLGLSPS
jgi:NAD(P)-dependent dehydrogenase (short-subunit alcohol dehydrogenase family)